jgi:hypothetical protein
LGSIDRKARCSAKAEQGGIMEIPKQQVLSMLGERGNHGPGRKLGL